MATTKRVTKVKPSVSIQSLEMFNEKVFLLIQQVALAIKHDLVDQKISESMNKALLEVQEFYDSNNA